MAGVRSALDDNGASEETVPGREKTLGANL